MFVKIDVYGTANKINTLRKEKGLSVRDVQEALGFNTPQAVYKWLRGDSIPSVDNLVVLSDLLDATIDEIIVREK
ncbi:MAG: helix-turn-helix transcriptional regulator [Erysipelotrichaceae bacterium]|nr:helix-turn-helix transcriptional regulator [Erysipelotrichaceae bacterium]